jgi:predicted RNA-binding Zn-ribbon protein involved in translation (DUF1610 family)
MSAVCPKCGKKIDYLMNYCKDVVEAYVFEIKDGEPEYSHVDTYYSGDSEYACPECGETLFYDEESAERFLKGEKVEVADADE